MYPPEEGAKDPISHPSLAAPQNDTLIFLLPPKNKLSYFVRSTAESILLPFLNSWCLKFGKNVIDNILLCVSKRERTREQTDAEPRYPVGLTGRDESRGLCLKTQMEAQVETLVQENQCSSGRQGSIWEAYFPVKYSGLRLGRGLAHSGEARSYLISPALCSSPRLAWDLLRIKEGFAKKSWVINNVFPLSCRNSGGRGTIRSAMNSLHSKSNRFVN